MLLMAAAAGACTVDRPSSQGRPCSDEQPCGPGTRCVDRICQPDQAPEQDGGGDLRRLVDGKADAPRIDGRQPDSFVAPDGGCPKGMTRCGPVCANLNSDFKHCGKCGNTCSGRADRCQAGSCSCGKSGKLCSSTLNCKQASCRCVVNGNCKGCCWGTTCRALGSTQSPDKCGKNGAVCSSCYDGNDCTTEGCSAGVCAKTNKADGASCDDKKACTKNDKCSAGSCQGSSYSCKPGQCQAASSCDGKGGCKTTAKANGTVCSDGNSCTYNDKCSAGSCKGSSYSCKPGQCQAASSCDGKGGCKTTARANGTVCSDGNSCTYSDKCSSGICKGTGYSCTVTDFCQASSVCNGSGGCSVTAKPNGTSCNDSISCTHSDKCSSGICKGTGYSCTVTNFCQASSVCNGTGGCSVTAKPNGTGCSDGNSCSYSDICSGGYCKGTSYSCNDSMSCTSDTCLGTAAPPTGCKNTLISGYCAIGSKCYSSGTPNPSNACQRCDTSKSTSSWTNSGSSGCVSTVAGTGSSSIMWNPADMAVGPGGKIYVADRSNSRILVISGSSVSTFAGTGVKGYKDGAASTAMFDKPQGIAVGASGRVYVADRYNHVIRMIVGGTVYTIGGKAGVYGYTDGGASSSRFYDPHDVEVDSSEAVYVADTGNRRIRRIYSQQVITLAGTGNSGFADGAALQTARFAHIYGLALDSSGAIYVADGGNMRIRKVYNGVVSTVAGSGTQGSSNGSTSVATFNYPQGVAVGASGMIYVADRSNHMIRKIYGGQVTTLAGTTSYGFADGPATIARFKYPFGVSYSGGKIYVADYDNNRIRMITP